MKHLLTITILCVAFGLQAQNPFPDSFCGINGPLVAQFDPLPFGATFSNATTPPTRYEVAAEYTPTSNSIINQICVVGGYFQGCTPNTFPDYKFVIYADNGGMPGAPLLGPINLVGSHVFTGTVLVNGAPNVPDTDELTVTLTFPNFALTSGTPIWISVAANNQ